ncbi:MAG TPA: hypothetical protein DEH25_09070 [Chloroflexi bacterium]|nr:hypothetical protein [Chloroflexota bacterium]HBY07074.1 hypothetical protein [Chloroflexota bacterium]
MSKLREIQEELKSVLSGRGARFFDSFLPLLVFLFANPLLGVDLALGAALATAGIFAIFRMLKRQSLVYALGGLGGVLLAGIFIKLSGSEAGFFLPGLISGALTIILCIVSVVMNRPMVAWTSFIARRWPLDWYWHPKVLPAYNEVTIIWAIAFSARLALEFWLYQRDAVNTLGVAQIFLGWPFIVFLLIATYLYGLRRLGRLEGPSVAEYKAGKQPPWQGQKRGF